MDLKRNVLITSALPYVNNVPHLGNIIGSVLSADVYSRYSRLRGYNVLFVCGTDEYGTTTEIRASQENLTPKEICDKYHALHKKIYDWFDISFDEFGRTSTDQHTQICHHVFNQLYDNHFLAEQTIDQLYCGNCSKFLADSLVEGQCPNPQCSHPCKGDQCEKCGAFIKARELVNPICKICHNPGPSFRTTNHLFLQLPALKEELCAVVRRFVISSQEAVATTWKLIDGDGDDKPLEPKCITRDLKWGVPVPLKTFSDKVLYVWFDAPLGYVSITKCHTSDWEFWWKNPDKVELHQFMGKDNVPFHTVLFPSMLIGTQENWTLPTSIHATQFLLYGTDKFSKSNGVGVFGDDVEASGIPVEVWRYYLISIRPEVSDTMFSWDDLQAKLNHELADNVGNLINRVLTFIAKPPGKGYDSVIPDLLEAEIEEVDLSLSSKIDVFVHEYLEAMEKGK
ncbi:unnamed protein product [Cuscuta campestris]|uniref:Methionyl-tRNA synthetase n=1 Tax=Cuscuta campestris TaxID=132261 RepID=A0A484LIM0_9ASTE|nr:unnamed protein product [Cuscuta campestris]